MDDLHTSSREHTPRLTADPSQEGIMRIREMERRLDEAATAVQGLEEALDRYEAVMEGMTALEAYLGSEEWIQDLADDEKGLLPQDLKRGVLSEDGIWNLLEDNRDIVMRMKYLSDKLLKE